MTRDTFDMFAARDRGRFGDVSSDNKVHVFILLLRSEHPLSIKVSEDDRLHARKITLPISQIKYEKRRNGYVRVEVPEWLAVKVGLV